MKKLLTITAAALMAISASAQSEAGSLTWKPNVGITVASVVDVDDDIKDSRSSAIGLTAGVEAMYMINDKFGVAAGLNYTGYNINMKEDKDYTASNYYFNVPVTANYYVAPGLALKAGIAMNLLSSAKVDGESKNPIGGKHKELYKSTFFSIPVGASYEINDFVFDARYNFGVSDAEKYGPGRLNAFTFTVGYKF